MTEKYVHPMDRLTQAAKQARKITKQIFNFATTRSLGTHAAAELLPAIEEARTWAQKAVTDAQLEAVRYDLGVLNEYAFELNFDLERIAGSDIRPNLKLVRKHYRELLQELRRTEKLLTKLGE